MNLHLSYMSVFIRKIIVVVTWDTILYVVQKSTLFDLLKCEDRNKNEITLYMKLKVLLSIEVT